MLQYRSRAGRLSGLLLLLVACAAISSVLRRIIALGWGEVKEFLGNFGENGRFYSTTLSDSQGAEGGPILAWLLHLIHGIGREIERSNGVVGVLKRAILGRDGW